MKFAVINFPGSSCNDVAEALKDSLHVDVEIVAHYDNDLSAYDGIILPGGFSYGDYVRPGALAKLNPAAKEVVKVANSGKPVLGIGNGFQVLLELGLLPGMMLPNKNLKFICKYVNIKVVHANTMFTQQYESEEVLSLPIAHEQGNYYCADATLQQLKEQNQIVFTYEGENPNGSLANIAGLINERGNVLGMMPQPERAIDELLGSADGRKLFHSIIEAWRETDVINA